MKRWIILMALLGVIGCAVYAYAFTPGRDNQPVSGTVTATNTIMVANDVQVDSAVINPYSWTEKSYTDVKAMCIYNGAKALRVHPSDTALNDTQVAAITAYFIIPAADTNYEKGALNFSTLYLYMETDSVDTPTVMLNIWK